MKYQLAIPYQTGAKPPKNPDSNVKPIPTVSPNTQEPLKEQK